MAKRMNSKIQPAVQNLFFATPEFSVPGGGQRTDFYIDISQCASLVNRRFYRQGLNWAVAGFKFNISSDIDSIEINKLPNTWIMSNSWEKGFRAWQKMNNNALAEAPSVKPKFLDFKIYADTEHHQKGFRDNLMPYAGAPSASSRYTAGEWESSKIITPQTGIGITPGSVSNLEVIATGPSYPGAGNTGLDAVSLIEGYAASRGLPDIKDPNTPLDAEDADGITPENWLTAMFNEGTRQDAIVIDDMITENNQAPYPFENGDDGAGGTFTDTMYPGGANQGPGLELHDVKYIANTAQTITLEQTLRGGNFPCGLVKISMTSSAPVTSQSSANLQLILVPGDHRGYLAEPMTEM